MFSYQNLLQNSHYHIFMPIYVCMYVCMYVCTIICEFMYLSFAMTYLLRHLLCACRFGSHQQTPGHFGLELGEPCWRRRVQVRIPVHCSSCWITSEIYSFLFFFSFFFRDSGRLHFDYYPASSRPLTGKGQPNRQVLTINALDMIAPVRSSSPTNSKILNKPILSFKDAMEGICWRLACSYLIHIHTYICSHIQCIKLDISWRQ